MARLAFAALILAACSSPSKATLDAPPSPDAPHPSDARPLPDAPTDVPIDAPPMPDLSCLGQPPPGTAPDPLAVDGTVFAIDHYQVAPLPGASVTLHRRSDDGVLATALTGSDGTFAMSVATGGVALDAYYTVAATGELPSRIDPGDPMTTGFFALAVVASDAEVQRWYGDAGASYGDGASPLISIAVDCNHAAVDGASVAIAPGATITYYDAAAQRWNPSLGASTNGFALITGGATRETATAAWHGQAFPPHAAVAPANTLSLAVASPYAPAAL